LLPSESRLLFFLNSRIQQQSGLVLSVAAVVKITLADRLLNPFYVGLHGNGATNRKLLNMNSSKTHNIACQRLKTGL
jgi:hypothetical protein